MGGTNCYSSRCLNSLSIIAGSGRYPLLLAESARRAGVSRICAAAFEGETDPKITGAADEVAWMRVGQLGKLLAALKQFGAPHAMMAGQIAPNNLFNLRPDFKALMTLAKLKERNAETLFGALADELKNAGVEVISAITFMEEHLAVPGVFAGPPLKERGRRDVLFGYRIAREISRLDIGQTVVVKNGTVLAVEAFEGTNEAILRGGELGRGAATIVKVSKPNQDFRFDVPVIGPVTLEIAAKANIRTLAVEAGRTLLIDKDILKTSAAEKKITIYGVQA